MPRVFAHETPSDCITRQDRDGYSRPCRRGYAGLHFFRLQANLPPDGEVPLPDLSIPDRTSPRGLEQFITGRTLLSGGSLAWSDQFVQVYSRHQTQDTFLVPAVAEPLVVWVMSGEALVEERELGGNWTTAHVKVGDFFLTRADTPYEMRWRAIGAAGMSEFHFSRLFKKATGVHRLAISFASGSLARSNSCRKRT